MDQRVIPFDYLRDLGDDDFYVHLNSNDAKSQRLSEFGVRTHWRNFLPLTLQLKDGDWEVALTQIMLKNVQHVDKELLIYKGDGTPDVEHRFPLYKSVFTDNLGLLDAVKATADQHDLDSLVGSSAHVSFKILITFNSYKTCLIHKYELPSSRDIADAVFGADDKLTTSNFLNLMKAANPHTYKMYVYNFKSEQEANHFILNNEDFERAGHEYRHASQNYYSFYGKRLGSYNDNGGDFAVTHALRAYISKSLLPLLRQDMKGIELQDLKGNKVWRTYDDNYVFDNPTIGSASHLFRFFLFSADPSADTVSYQVGRPIAIQAEGKTRLMPFQKWDSTLSSFLKNLNTGDFFIESVTPSLFQLHVHDLPFKYPIVADKGEKLQGLIYTLLNAKKETTVFNQVRGDRLRYFPLENVKVKHLDVKVSNLDGIKEAPTFLTGYTQLTLHFRRNYLDLQRDRPHEYGDSEQ